MDQLTKNAQRMLQLFDRMRQQRGPAVAQISALNLSFSHMRALRLLASSDVLAMKDLADQLQLTPPSVTALSRRLVQTGLVSRTSDPTDSRVTLLTLTEAGRDLHRQLFTEHVRSMEQLLSGLSTADQALFLNLLERAVEALEQKT